MSRPGAAEHGLTLDLPAAHRGVRVARSVLGRFARMQGMPQCEADTLLLVASELLGNAIDHGGGGAAMTEADLTLDVRMRVSFTVHATGWRLDVTDQGGGDAAEVQLLLESDRSLDLEDDRGRGLFLLKESVDQLDASVSPDGTGITISVRKEYGGSG